MAMSIRQFKRVARILKEAWKELEEESLREGIDIFSEEYENLQDLVREKILANLGFTLEEYIEAKEIVSPSKEQKTKSVVVEELSKIHIPTTEEIKDIAKTVPPKIINKIVKETVKIKPTIIKETIIEHTTERVEFDDTALKQEITSLREQVEGIEFPEAFDVEAFKKDAKGYFGELFQYNIDTLGMPDFRKLAMGLQGQIDEINQQVQTFDLTSEVNGTLKVFTVPKHTTALAVLSTQRPLIFRPTIDFTTTDTVLTLTSEVSAPQTGQTLLFIYS